LVSGGSGSSIIAAYAVVKAHEPKVSESADVHAAQAALDEGDLQELEAELYGAGAGPARELEPVETERIHGTRPRVPHRGA
jgi:hypothetical protein